MTVMLSVVAEVAFWTCAAVVAYVYVGYPLTLMAMRARPIRSAPERQLPRVTILIAAYNEVRHIAATVRNKLAQDYPPELLDVVVVSDGSSDGTDTAVAALEGTRVKLLRQEPRQGKTAALNLGVDAARGDVVVVSDANSQYEVDTVRRLVEPFADPTVGYVTGQLLYQDPGETPVGGGSGLYMRYENWLRELETRAGSVVGVNGGVDAVRKKLYVPMRPDQLPDFILPLRVVEAGYRTVYCRHAIAREQALGRQHDEYVMRVRVSLRALHALYEMRALLRPRFGLFAFQLLVHKVLRYLLILAMVLALLATGILATSAVYAALLACQLVFYGLALVGFLSGGRVGARPVFIPYYFCLVNLAAGAALLRFLRGDRQVVWTPRKGA